MGIEIDSDTAATRWRGERMNYELGVWVLCRQHERAQRARLQAEPLRTTDRAKDDDADEYNADPAPNVMSNVAAATRQGSAKHA